MRGPQGGEGREGAEDGVFALVLGQTLTRLRGGYLFLVFREEVEGDKEVPYKGEERR